MADPAPSPTRFPVIAMVASVGGLAAFESLLAGLPADLPAALLVVQHLEPNRPSLLAEILGRHTGLIVKQAEPGDRLRPGAVFIAPPDRHLLVDRDGVLSLAETRPVHFVRPAADRLLESVAWAFGRRAIAVILTGSGQDGADGVRIIKQEGGTVIAQDSPTSRNFGMPGAAIHTGCVDSILPLGEIAPALIQLVATIEP